ncbi:kinase domain protein (macronuclear) [Tetrahymena thermophila SB210]|uniref:Casein kinase I n=1 Tax=Tetrahymena thermophila (strain SB210) TaxID=312017 RepID=Q22DQ9_TETTS|nr:kinase domain protein [Tetrahymena thermophila SB210]EAR83395.2 kinase domain protein [Tetrahymena thermophila SB210]|eukprot:XP_001031058.2 kinase domain protein [Tetrahymena thermophila SB210]
MIVDDQISQQKDTSSNIQGSNMKEKRSITPKKRKNQIFIHNQFLVQECIYKGNFYNTYKGFDKEAKKNVVIKMCNQYHDHISHELKIIKHLVLNQNNVTCFVPPIWQGEEKIAGVNYQVKVLKQMGPSLKIVFSLLNKQFMQHTVLLIGLNLINSIENLHKHDIVHRNLRPRKIITDFNLKSLNLYFVDFKNAKKFRHKSGQTVKYIESNRQQNKAFANKFSSLGVHMGISPSQKDDMESIGYILIYFLKKGKLFHKKKSYQNHEEKINHYEEQKLNFVPENYKEILPAEVISYINYIKMLNQQDRIDYDYCKKLFKTGIQRFNISAHEQRYEWSTRIKEDLITFSNQQNNGNILNQQIYELSSKVPLSEQNLDNSFLKDYNNTQLQNKQEREREELQLRDKEVSIEVRKNTEETNHKLELNASVDQGINENSQKQIVVQNGTNSQIQITQTTQQQLNQSFNSVQNKEQQIYPYQQVRVVIGSQIHVIGDNEQDVAEIGEKYDYQAFLRMNSTDEKNQGGFVRMSSQTLESQFLKDPFQRQASNLSRKSDRSLFSRFNSKSFDEGISDETNTEFPSLEKQIMSLGGGINPFNMFSASKRNKYFSSHNIEKPSFYQQSNSQIDEVEEFSEVQVHNNQNYYKIEND